MPVIRLAKIDDVPKLAEVERAAASLFRDVGLAWIAEAEPLQAAWLIRRCEQRMVWVVTDTNGLPVGFLAADLVDGDFYIAEVSVAPSAQNAGNGTALIDAAIRRAIADGFARVILTTYRDLPWNGPFYSRLGFAEVDIAAAGPELLEKIRAETMAGHDPARRCVMAKVVATPTPDDRAC
jgi:GNAT superfamily N-acetyltransferase